MAEILTMPSSTPPRMKRDKLCVWTAVILIDPHNSGMFMSSAELALPTRVFSFKVDAMAEAEKKWKELDMQCRPGHEPRPLLWSMHRYEDETVYAEPEEGTYVKVYSLEYVPAQR